MKYAAKHTAFWVVFCLLVVMHHDWWFWTDGRLLFGTLPMGLAYHAGISMAAGALWTWAVFGVYADVFEADPEELAGPKAGASQPDV